MVSILHAQEPHTPRGHMYLCQNVPCSIYQHVVFFPLVTQQHYNFPATNSTSTRPTTEETLDAAWNIPNFIERSSILTSNYGLFKARFYKTRVLTLPGTPSSPWRKLYSHHTPWDDAPCHRFRGQCCKPRMGRLRSRSWDTTIQSTRLQCITPQYHPKRAQMILLHQGRHPPQPHPTLHHQAAATSLDHTSTTLQHITTDLIP